MVRPSGPMVRDSAVFGGPQGSKNQKKFENFPNDPKSILVTKSSRFGPFWAAFGSWVIRWAPLELSHWPQNRVFSGCPVWGHCSHRWAKTVQIAKMGFRPPLYLLLAVTFVRRCVRVS